MITSDMIKTMKLQKYDEITPQDTRSNFSDKYIGDWEASKLTL